MGTNILARRADIQFRNVAVPMDVFQLLRELAELDQRSMARELAVLIKEAHGQLIGQPSF